MITITVVSIMSVLPYKFLMRALVPWKQKLCKIRGPPKSNASDCSNLILV